MANDKLFQKLVLIQKELKSPKDLTNNFGKFNYRNIEKIYESVKPLLTKYEVSLFLTDEIVEIGNRIYVKAKATITDGKDSITVEAYAREGETKAGMDVAQITGSASSYARKYALGGLFLLDDNKDIDSMDNSPEQVATPTPKTLKKTGFVDDLTAAKKELFKVLEESGIQAERMKDFLQAQAVNITNTVDIKAFIKKFREEHTSPFDKGTK